MKNKHYKNKKRCIYSNKLIEGKEVVIREYVKDYALKDDFIEMVTTR